MGVKTKFHGQMNLSGPRGPWQIGLREWLFKSTLNNLIPIVSLPNKIVFVVAVVIVEEYVFFVLP